MGFWCRMLENQEQEVSMWSLGNRWVNVWGDLGDSDIAWWCPSDTNTLVVLMSSGSSQRREISSKGITGKWGSIFTNFSIHWNVLECKLHKGKAFCLLFLFYPSALAQCLPHTGWSINICRIEWINEQMNESWCWVEKSGSLCVEATLLCGCAEAEEAFLPSRRWSLCVFRTPACRMRAPGILTWIIRYSFM